MHPGARRWATRQATGDGRCGAAEANRGSSAQVLPLRSEMPTTRDHTKLQVFTLADSLVIDLYGATIRFQMRSGSAFVCS